MVQDQSENKQQFICAICNCVPAGFCKICPVTLGWETRYDLIECSECLTRQLFPLPSDEALDKFYNTNYYGGDWYKQRGWGMTFARWYLSNKQSGKFLDVGCGLGYFIEGIRKASNWEVFGTEFGEESVAHAKAELDLDIFHGELQSAGFPEEEFDFIRICNVLEHVKDPIRMLEESRRIIKKDGRLELSIPNGLTDSHALLNFYNDENEPPLSKDGHLFFFPKSTLLRLIEQTGFEVESAGTMSVRRGMRVLGKYPQRKNWKNPYYAANKENAPVAKIMLSPEKKRPDIYYHFRRALITGKMFKGLREYGLEFKLLLRPRKS